MSKPNTLATADRPGYKYTPLGWIPEDWEVVKLKDIGSISSGSTPLRSEYKYFQNGSTPWVKTTDLNNGYIYETEEKVTDFALENTSLRIYNKGVVLVAMYGGFNQIGRTGLLKIDAAINQALSAISLKNDKADAEFLLQWLNANVGLWKQFAGSSRKDPNITSKDVGDFPFIAISLPEQRAIACILSTWDAAIDKQQKLIAAHERRKKALMQQLLTGKKRLPGFSGEWKGYEYEELLKEVKRPIKWNDEELYDLISVRRRSGGLFHRESLYGKQILTKNLKTAKDGDFLISKMQVVHGATGLVSKEFDGMKISGSYIALVARNRAVLNIEFLNWYSKLPYFYHQTYISSFGVHIEKMTFDFESFLVLKIKLPSLPEQTAIANVLQVADKEINLLQQQLDAYREQKKGLMQVLLTGKVRVRNLEG